MGNFYDQTHSKDPWPGALAWVNFDEGGGTSAADATGNGFGATLVGGATWGTTDSGKPSERFSAGSFATFDTSGTQYARCGSPLGVVPDAWTLAFRIRFNNALPSGKWLMSSFNSDSVGCIGLLSQAGGPIQLRVNDSAGNFATALSLTTAWDVLRWYMFAITWGKGDGYEFRVDDVLECALSPASVGKIANGTVNPLMLGGLAISGTFSPMNVGWSFDNLRVIPRRLNAQQIAALARQEPTYPQHAAEDRVTAHGGVILPGAGDENSCQESNVLYNSTTGLFEALVHCGWTTSYYRYYSSPDGITWTRGAIVLGNGVGGEADAGVGRGSIVLKSGTYYKFYDTLTGGIKYATATAMAGPWTAQGTIVANAAVSTYGTRAVGPAAYWDEASGLWVLLAQILDAGNVWRMILITGATLGALTIDTTAGLLTDLQVGSGMYGGYYLTKLRDGRYCLLYHTASGPSLNTPTVGRAATSWDLKRWAQYPIPLRQIRGEISNQDQVADLHAVEANGTLYVFYDLVDNVAPAAKIAVMTFAGTLDDWLIDGPAVDAGSGRLSTTFTAPRQALFAQGVQSGGHLKGKVLGNGSDAIKGTGANANVVDASGTAGSTLAAIKTQTDKIANGVNVLGGFVKGNLSIRQGDSYTPTSGQRLKIPRPAAATWPADLTGWTVTLTGKARSDVTTVGTRSFTTVLTVDDPAGFQDLYPDALTATDTAGLAPYINGWDFTIRAVKNSDPAQVNTLLSGVLSVAPQLTP